jgi:hypothetical protein
MYDMCVAFQERWLIKSKGGQALQRPLTQARRRAPSTSIGTWFWPGGGGAGGLCTDDALDRAVAANGFCVFRRVSL